MAPWWNAACRAPPISAHDWDFSPCFEDTTLSLLPVVILAAIGGAAFPRLATQLKQRDVPLNGDKTRGKSALAVKLVCSASTARSIRESDELRFPPQAVSAALVLAQIGSLITIIVTSHRLAHDPRFWFALLALSSYVRQIPRLHLTKCKEMCDLLTHIPL